MRGGALSRVAAPLCLGCRAIGNEEEEEEKKREEEAARSSNRGARVSVCVDGRGHHRRRPTHKTFPILYKTNDKRKLSSRLSFAFCVSRPTTEAKHHHHHHGWRRRAREAHEGTTTRPPFFFRRAVLVKPIGFLFSSSSSLQNAKEEEKPKRFFFSTIIRDYNRFQKEEVNKKQELTTLFVANTTNSLTHRNDQPTNKKGQNHREQPNETKADRIKRDG